MFRDSIMTKWNEFVKKWAEEHGLTYGCSLSTPECKLDYQMSKGTRLPARTTRLPKPTGKAPSMRGNRPAPPPPAPPAPRTTSSAKKSYQGSSAPRSNSNKLSAPMTQSKAILMGDIYLPTPPPTPPPVGDLLQQHYDRIEREHLREYGPKHKWGRDERLSYSNERHKYEWLKEQQLGAFNVGDSVPLRPPHRPQAELFNIQHHTIPQPPSREPVEDPEDAQGWSSGEEEVIEEGWWETDGLHIIKHGEVLQPQVAFSEEEPPLYLQASAITKVSPRPQYTITQDIPVMFSPKHGTAESIELTKHQSLVNKKKSFNETLAFMKEERARNGPLDAWGTFAPGGSWESSDEEEGQLKKIVRYVEPPSRSVAKPTEDHLKSTVSAKVAPQVAQTNHINGYVANIVNPYYIEKYGPTQAWDANRWKFYNEEVDMAIKRLGGEEKERLKKTRGPYNKDPDKPPPPEPAFRRGPYKKKQPPFFVNIS